MEIIIDHHWMWSLAALAVVGLASLAGGCNWFDDCDGWFCHDSYGSANRVNAEFNGFVLVFSLIIVIGVVWVLCAAATSEPSVAQTAQPIRPTSIQRVEMKQASSPSQSAHSTVSKHHSASKTHAAAGHKAHLSPAPHSVKSSK